MSTSDLVRARARALGPSLVQRGLQRAASSTIIYIFLALMAIVVTITILAPAGTFLSAFNLRNIANDASMVLIFGVATTLVVITGRLDLSIGSVATFSGVVTVQSMQALTDAGLGPWVTIALGSVLALAAGMAWGCVNGWLIAYGRLNFFVVTLGSLGAALGVSRLMTHGLPIYGTPPELTDSIGLGVWLGVPVPFLIAAVTALAFGLILAGARFGEHLYLVGSNEEAARRAGINVRRQVFTAYVLSGALAGLAGVVDAARFDGAAVATGHITELIAAIAGVVIGGASLAGGVGVMLGTVIGVFIPTVLTNGLVILKVEHFWQEVVVGIILVAAVAFDQWRRQRG